MIKTTYQNNLNNYTSELKQVSKQFMQIVYLRLLVFLGAGGLIYLFWDQSPWTAIIAILSITVFIYLVKKSTEISYQKRYFKSLITINESELLALNGIYEQFENGEQYINPHHNYSYDIDLFGEGSFFQYINRCQTLGGANHFAKGLIDPVFENIENRQIAVKELSKDLDWNQNYMATAALIESELKDVEVKNWITNYKTIIPSFFKYVLWIFPIISILVIGAIYIDILPLQAIYLNLLIGIGITSIYLKKINIVHGHSSKITNTLQQYAKLLIEIEDNTFESPLLLEWQSTIRKDGLKASFILNKLYKIFNALDQRSNVLIAIIMNGLFLSDLRATFRLDQWMRDFQAKSVKWFEAIYIFDELISIGNYFYNHPKTTFPKINDTLSLGQNPLIAVKDLGHPLIADLKRVNNNYELQQDHFTIITGANMAGKSTFLRALGLNIVMANNGMPVTAKDMTYIPIKLISSMRTTDSLNKEESYFFSELKRLKYIVDACKADSYFIILDEILKGTNSKDKAEGSKKFLERMRTSGSSGLIATHDLSLCELSELYAEFNNKYFDADIIDDELYFDYKLKEGQCSNMNASFLLKKMDIV